MARSRWLAPTYRRVLAPGIIPLSAHFALGEDGVFAPRPFGRSGDVAGCPFRQGESGIALRELNGVAGGRSSTDMNDARGFETGLAGPSA